MQRVSLRSRPRSRSWSALVALRFPLALQLALLLGLAGALGGCGAIYPELGTRVEAPPAGVALEPPPPAGLRWVAFEKAEVPPKTRDGRAWGRVQDGLPDPVARLFVNDVEVIKTNAAPKTLSPTWEDSRSGNFPIAVGDKLRVEVWDNDPLQDRAIGRAEGRVSQEMLSEGRWHASFDMGGSVTLAIAPARARWGLGFWYELRQGGSGITRLLDHSPAARAGLQKGDTITVIGKTEVSKMTSDEVRSSMNSPPVEGLALTVRHPDGSTLEATVKPGPIYPTFAQFGAIR